MKGYLRTDMKRLFHNRNFYLAIIGVILLYFYSLEQKGLRNDVLETFIASVTGSGIHIAAVLCAFAFATVICEDFEYLYCRYMIIRSDIKWYIISKVIVIYAAAVLVMVLGTVGFCLLCSLRIPWAEMNDSAWNMAVSGNYSIFLQEGSYLLYFFMYALQLGIYMGLLSICAAYISTYTSNTALVLICPIVLDQFLMELPWSPVDFVKYEPFLGLYRNDWTGLVILFLWSALPSAGLSYAIFRRTKKRIS